MFKTKQFLKRFIRVFSREYKKRCRERYELKCVLKKLNHKKRQLLASIDGIEDAEEKAYRRRELEIIHVHRLKGIAMIKQLKKQIGSI